VRSAGSPRAWLQRTARSDAAAAFLENPFDVINEPHLQHFVALIEHEKAQIRKGHRPTIHVIPSRVGRADNDMRAALEALELWGVTLTAIDRQNVEAR